MVFRARDLLGAPADPDHQRLAGPSGRVWLHAAAKGVPHVAWLIERIEDPDTALPQAAEVGATRARRDPALSARADRRARRGDRAPGQGRPARPPADDHPRRGPGRRHGDRGPWRSIHWTFKAGRHFAAWVGAHAPGQKSTGGKQRLGAISPDGRTNPATAADYRGQRRKLVKQALLRGAPGGFVAWPRCWRASPGCWSPSPWPTRPPSIIWALMARGGVYRAPVAAA